ncbi:MAG: hypothetical protein PHV36_07770 [Elusimicrobiales bacterium]|nr:hypothetical protein [Elusimicrobiales bacterium]
MADCTVCGNTLKPGEEEGGLCFSCRVGRLQEKVPQQAASAGAPAPAGKRFPIKPFLLGAVIAACAAGTAVILPGAVKQMRAAQPLRLGTYDTDNGGDWCIGNLWKAAAQLQSGGSTVNYSCPVSHAAYLVEVSTGEIVVSCPNPEKHGLRELSASSVAPVPRAIK